MLMREIRHCGVGGVLVHLPKDTAKVLLFCTVL